MSGPAEIILEGPVTVKTVPEIAARVMSQIASGARRIDFSKVTDVDSAAIALALDIQRCAGGLGVSVSILNLPDAFRNLANLYGVTELIDAPVP